MKPHTSTLFLPALQFPHNRQSSRNPCKNPQEYGCTDKSGKYLGLGEKPGLQSSQAAQTIQTGNGKGKTTAAFGLAVRALCAGKSVYIGQFVKSMRYNETKIGQLFDQVKIEQLGRGCFIGKDPEAIDIRMARDGLTRCAALLESGEYDVVILDELTIALHFGLLTIDAVLDALNRRHPAVEVVVTGRYAPQELIDAADLVTEMREIKHYYTQGVLSRDGIDR